MTLLVLITCGFFWLNNVVIQSSKTFALASLYKSFSMRDEMPWNKYSLVFQNRVVTPQSPSYKSGKKVQLCKLKRH